MTDQLNEIREALEYAFGHSDNAAVHAKIDKALAALSRLEAAADHIVDANKMAPELSREDAADKLRKWADGHVDCASGHAELLALADALVRSVPVGDQS